MTCHMTCHMTAVLLPVHSSIMSGEEYEGEAIELPEIH